jgi:hypothetical protein
VSWSGSLACSRTWSRQQGWQQCPSGAAGGDGSGGLMVWWWAAGEGEQRWWWQQGGLEMRARAGGWVGVVGQTGLCSCWCAMWFRN